MDPIVEETQYNTQNRVQTVNAPAKQVITQPVVQEYVHEREIHHVQNPVVRRVPVARPVPVPTPVLNKVPIIRRIPVPIRKKGSGATKIYNYSNLNFHKGESYSSSSSSSEEGEYVESLPVKVGVFNSEDYPRDWQYESEVAHLLDLVDGLQSD